jgi:hypothetical protein
VGNAVNERTVWSLRGTVADLNCGNLSARIDASRPSAGLYDVSIAGVQHVSDLLRVHRTDGAVQRSWPLALTESYVRGNDLVASYEATEEWPFSPQLYWQADSLRAVAGVLASASLLVSVQTHLLDTVPQIAVASLVPCDESPVVLVSGCVQPVVQTTLPTNEDCCVVSRLKDVPFSYIEIMPAGDFHATSLHAEGKGVAFEWRLFAEFLEKGVIRRARLHAAIVPREKDVEIAAACCKAIDRLQLPLTT